jgi:hypothetical protein
VLRAPKEAKPDSAPAKKRDVADYLCVATGCPARATIFATVIGQPKHGRCRYHDDAPTRLWPSVTSLLLASKSIEKTNHGLELLGLTVRVPATQLPPWDESQSEDTRIVTNLDERLPNGETPREILGKMHALMARRGADDPNAWWQRILREHDEPPPPNAPRLTLCSANLKAALRAREIAAPPQGESESDREARIEREGMKVS